MALHSSSPSRVSPELLDATQWHSKCDTHSGTPRLGCEHECAHAPREYLQTRASVDKPRVLGVVVSMHGTAVSIARCQIDATETTISSTSFPTAFDKFQLLTHNCSVLVQVSNAGQVIAEQL